MARPKSLHKKQKDAASIIVIALGAIILALILVYVVVNNSKATNADLGAQVLGAQTSQVAAQSILSEMVSSSANAFRSETVAAGVGIFTVKFVVAPTQYDIYLPSNPSQGISYAFQNKEGGSINPAGTAAVFNMMGGGNLTPQGYYRIPKGGRATFQVAGFLAAPQGGAQGEYKLVVNGINYARTSGGSAQYSPFAAPFSSNYVFVKSQVM